jgi:microcystin-dependent protein
MPTHQHTLQANIKATTGGVGVASPGGAFFGDKGGDPYIGVTGTSNLAPDALTLTLAPAGGSQPHTNLQPTLAIRYIMAMQGIYPSQP